MRVGTWLLASLVGVGAVSAFELQRRLDAEQARSAGLEARIRELDHALESSRATTADRAPPSTTAPPPPLPKPTTVREPNGLVAVPSPFGGSQPVTVDDRDRMRALQERQRLLWKDPEYRAAMVEQSKLGLRQLYGDAQRELGLSAAEMEHLLTLVAEQRMPDAEALAPAPTDAEGRPDPTQMQRGRERVAERQRQRDAEIRKLLGEQRYAQWQEYERSMPERMRTKMLRVELASAGLSLDATQEQSLARLVQDEQRRMSADFAKLPTASPATGIGAPDAVALRSGAVPPSAEEQLRRQRLMLEATERANQRLRDGAAAFLSPEQLAAFMQQRDSSLARERAMLRVQESMARTAAGPVDADR